MCSSAVTRPWRRPFVKTMRRLASRKRRRWRVRGCRFRGFGGSLGCLRSPRHRRWGRRRDVHGDGVETGGAGYRSTGSGREPRRQRRRWDRRRLSRLPDSARGRGRTAHTRLAAHVRGPVLAGHSPAEAAAAHRSGRAITGLLAYLETRGTTTHSSTEPDTPFGPLTIVAIGRYYVDWGDGTRTGPHSAEGKPWPEGRITHEYIHIGDYDVVVTERWTATWSFGSESGSLDELRTVGRIDDFPVQQIQAVVLR